MQFKSKKTHSYFVSMPIKNANCQFVDESVADLIITLLAHALEDQLNQMWDQISELLRS